VKRATHNANVARLKKAWACTASPTGVHVLRGQQGGGDFTGLSQRHTCDHCAADVNVPHGLLYRSALRAGMIAPPARPPRR
jgi:hypothetical protein